MTVGLLYWVGHASGLLNLLPFLGLIASLALPLAAALLQFNTPGPFIVITLTILFLHVVSANFLIPKFIATRVSIGPVAATVGILFWGWLWGVMGLLLAVPLRAFIKLVADLHPSLCHLSHMLALNAASDSALGEMRRNGFGTDGSLRPQPYAKASVGANPKATRTEGAPIFSGTAELSSVQGSVRTTVCTCRELAISSDCCDNLTANRNVSRLRAKGTISCTKPTS